MEIIARLIIFCFLITFTAKGQFNLNAWEKQDNERRQQVIEKGIVDSLFVFGKWTEGGMTDELHLTYLGQVTTIDSHVFKIMNYNLIWGLAHRGTQRILIFNDKNQYVGEYGAVTMFLPKKLENGILIFQNDEVQYCEQKITKVYLTKGLPKSFLHCGSPFTFGSL